MDYLGSSYTVELRFPVLVSMLSSALVVMSVDHPSAPVDTGSDDDLELTEVLALAVATVADACGLDQESDPGHLDKLEQAALAAVVSFYRPIASAAAQLAVVAEQTQVRNAASVAETAREMAVHAAETATALQASEKVTDAARRGTGTAHQDAQTVEQAAAVRSDRRGEAAELVARSVQRAAALVAEAAETAAHALESETVSAAAAVRAAALATCYQLALAAAHDAAASLDRR